MSFNTSTCITSIHQYSHFEPPTKHNTVAIEPNGWKTTDTDSNNRPQAEEAAVHTGN